MIQFKRIDNNTIAIISEMVAFFDTYSDFNPLSLLCWDTHNQYQYVIHNNNLVIKIQDYLNNTVVYSILGKSHVISTLNALEDITKNYKYVPEITLKELVTLQQVNVVEDRDSYDYIIDNVLLTELHGSELKNFRKLKVKAYNLGYRIQELDLHNNYVFDNLKDITKQWAQSKNFEISELEDSIIRIKRYQQFHKQFNTLNFGLYKNQQLVGYSFNEITPQNIGMGHFGVDISGSLGSTYLELNLCEILSNKNIKFTNLQQDTGIESLRAGKSKYKPVKFLKKYNIYF